MSDSRDSRKTAMLDLREEDLLECSKGAVESADTFLQRATEGVRSRIRSKLGHPDSVQDCQHALAWAATTVEALRQMYSWGSCLGREDRLGEFERLLLITIFSEYLSQLSGGIPMGQTEMARPIDLGMARADVLSFEESVRIFTHDESMHSIKLRLSELIAANPDSVTFGDCGLDQTHAEIFHQIHRFGQVEVVPHAHKWHSNNEYIPLELVDNLADFGVFGLTFPERYGGSAMGKEAMCLVSEALSRAYIGVGSLGTRSEIAGELILTNGTEEQKGRYLPSIASGKCLPTAVFTEPNYGSDLAALKTRARLSGDNYVVDGQKTWITHPVRSDLMTLLVRTDPEEKGYKGLSIFIAEKSRGDDLNPFPDEGLTGSEIHVLGYRGMKEYDISFDNYRVPRSQLLGGKENQGFKQLMKTFESARIQTAARALGVAQCAMDLGLKYALERNQFGKPIYTFARISGKIVSMAAQIMAARQLTLFAAREKDAGRRCDMEAGMAKLLAARVAWACADDSVQIHGGNGFATEYEISRVLCDARVFSIFEGTSEIQAHVIARGLLNA